MAPSLLPLFQAIDAEWIGTEVLWPNLYHFIDCFYRQKGAICSQDGCLVFPTTAPGKADSPSESCLSPCGQEAQGPGWRKVYKRHSETNLGPILCCRKLKCRREMQRRGKGEEEEEEKEEEIGEEGGPAFPGQEGQSNSPPDFCWPP